MIVSPSRRYDPANGVEVCVILAEGVWVIPVCQPFSPSLFFQRWWFLFSLFFFLRIKKGGKRGSSAALAIYWVCVVRFALSGLSYTNIYEVKRLNGYEFELYQTIPFFHFLNQSVSTPCCNEVWRISSSYHCMPADWIVACAVLTM